MVLLVALFAETLISVRGINAVPPLEQTEELQEVFRSATSEERKATLARAKTLVAYEFRSRPSLRRTDFDPRARTAGATFRPQRPSA